MTTLPLSEVLARGTRVTATQAMALERHALAMLPELVGALERMTKRYTDLANSGDAGNWDAEAEHVIIDSRAVLAKANQVPMP